MRRQIDQIGLVAYLEMQGIKPVSTSVEAETFYWEFRSTPRLKDEIEKYETNKGEVDPKEYGAVHVRLKREMFAALDRV